YVRAIDNDVVDGDAIQAFAQQTRTLDAIQGPLTIEGGNDPNADTTIPPPVMYIAETDPHEFVPDPNPNFQMLEPEQVDVLGPLTDTQLTGFGMHTGRTIAGKAYPAGVVYSDIELLRVDTGNGNDRLRIDSTHGNVTLVNAGPGADQINVRTVGGPTLINGQAGNDRVDVGSNYDNTWFGAEYNHQTTLANGVLERIRAFLRIDGGVGSYPV